MEEWRKIKGADASVSNKGQVRRDSMNAILVHSTNCGGHPSVRIFYGEKRLRKQVDRLVIENFTECKISRPKILHKDGDLLNSALENLQVVLPGVVSEWRKIGSSTYSASSCGAIRSDLTHQLIKGTPDSGGYLHVSISGVTSRVNRLVAIAFLENPENLPEVDHLDSDVLNNAVANLEWVTTEENLRRARANGNNLKGEGNGRAKLSTEDVLLIRKSSAEGLSAKDISEVYGMNDKTISQIINRTLWSHA
jgi:hypothetical protein